MSHVHPSGKRVALIYAALVGLICQPVYAEEVDYKHTILKANAPAGGAAEYFTSAPDAKVLIPINIWGEVARPGVHFVSIDANIRQSISSAGGPNGVASMPEIKLIRKGKTSYVDLLKNADKYPVQEYDTLVVERSFIRGDLPATLGILGTILGIVSVSIALSRN